MKRRTNNYIISQNMNHECILLYLIIKSFRYVLNHPSFFIYLGDKMSKIKLKKKCT